MFRTLYNKFRNRDDVESGKEQCIWNRDDVGTGNEQCIWELVDDESANEQLMEGSRARASAHYGATESTPFFVFGAVVGPTSQTPLCARDALVD